MKALNALTFYFKQFNDKIDSKKFAFYLVINGRQLGIYNYRLHVLQQIENCPNSCYKGFSTYHEALAEAQKHLGLHGFSISPSISPKLLSLTSSIQFCDHCEVMTRTIIWLNNKYNAFGNKSRQL